MDGFNGNMDHFYSNISRVDLGLLDDSAGSTDGTPVYWGYIAAVVAVIFYGSNFVPVKKFETGDGLFFQLILCTAIMFVGLVVNIARGSPTFYPSVMIGGVIWAIGNICVVPIIKTIGIGLGICIWGTTNLLAGWASGRFGAFGLITPEVPKNTTLNYIGVALAVCSATVYLFVRSEVSMSLTIEVEETQPLLSPEPPREGIDYRINEPGRPPSGPIASQLAQEHGESIFDRLSPSMKRIVGSVLSCISGIFYGVSFTPAINVQDMVKGSSQNGLDYVFAHFSGIFATSVTLFVIYAAYMRNAPKIYPKAILPGIISGAMWAVATSCWFVANKVLSEPVSFPIVTTGPGIVASIWGVVVFKEIRGHRNLILLGIAFLLTCSCGIVSGFSKG